MRLAILYTLILAAAAWAGTEVASFAPPLPEAKGGTNQTTYTAGDTLYASGSNTLGKLGAGTINQSDQVNSGGTAPSWANWTTEPRLLYFDSCSSGQRPSGCTLSGSGTYQGCFYDSTTNSLKAQGNDDSNEAWYETASFTLKTAITFQVVVWTESVGNVALGGHTGNGRIVIYNCWDGTNTYQSIALRSDSTVVYNYNEAIAELTDSTNKILINTPYVITQTITKDKIGYYSIYKPGFWPGQSISTQGQLITAGTFTNTSGGGSGTSGLKGLMILEGDTNTSKFWHIQSVAVYEGFPENLYAGPTTAAFTGGTLTSGLSWNTGGTWAFDTNGENEVCGPIPAGTASEPLIIGGTQAQGTYDASGGWAEYRSKSNTVTATGVSNNLFSVGLASTDDASMGCTIHYTITVTDTSSPHGAQIVQGMVRIVIAIQSDGTSGTSAVGTPSEQYVYTAGGGSLASSFAVSFSSGVATVSDTITSSISGGSIQSSKMSYKVRFDMIKNAGSFATATGF
jgi:hypothetical protein